MDNTITSMPDLGTNFFVRKEDVGVKTRAQASLPHLQELNQYVEVQAYEEEEITTEFLSQFNVVVFTEYYNQAKLIEFNEFCRSRDSPIGFVWAGSLALYGWTFVDFGPNHVIFDKNGERSLTAIVSSISKEKEGLVTVSDDERHGFEDGDWVTFREVKGMTEINGQEYQVEVVSPFSFKIGDTSEFSSYIRDGSVEQIKKPFTFPQKSLKEALVEPHGNGARELIDPDLDYMNMNLPYELHLILKGILAFYGSNKRLPELLNEEDSIILQGIIEHKVNEIKEQKSSFKGEKEPSLFRIEEVSIDLIKNVSLLGRAQVPPFNSFWGGIVAQEVVKYTGKFTPLNQWLHYSVFNRCLPDTPVTRTNDESSMQRDQTIIFGEETIDKLKKLNLFMIGAGALGCEYLKQFALMGACTAEGSMLYVTDDDVIAISNLNRQFLFRREHVDKSKADVATAAAKVINSELNVCSIKNRAEPATEDIFNDQFWDKLDCVFGAVDNIKARQYVDRKCVFHGKHLLESGTLGTKCNSQVIIPEKTECYSDSHDPEEKSIPMCTLRHFPYLLDHTIERARDVFHGFFNDASSDFARLIKCPSTYIDEEMKIAGQKISGLKEKFEFLSFIAHLWEDKSLQGLANTARQFYQTSFIDEINQLLFLFPHDFVDDDGRPFWSSPKRAPHAIEFDLEDDQILMFGSSVVKILAYAFGIEVTWKEEDVKAALQNAKFTVAEPKRNKKQEIGGDETNDQDNAANDHDETLVLKIAEELKKIKTDETFCYNAIEFEKDDDSNGHIDFMASYANLRARNYDIEEAQRYKIKLIAGKIIPAIATTTAMVVGMMGIELYKVVLNKPIESFRNGFATLALPHWVFSEPLPPTKHVDQELDPVMFMPVVAYPPGNLDFNF